MPADTTAGKREMLDKCYTYYRGNKKELQNIQEFERTYTSDDAIRWYTKDCFIYRLVNKALRTEDIDVLYTFRYFIIGLSACLGKYHQLWKQCQKIEILRLYRGIKQTNDETKRLKESIGSLISTNGFFSTTKSKSVAKIYAGIGYNDTKYESLLFEIDIDTQTHANCIFADISSYSHFADEQEVLFDLGTVFEIVSVDYNSTDKYWICRMMTTSRGMEIAEEYLTFRKSEMTGTNVDLVILFGHLLYDMGEYNRSQKYFEKLLTDRGNDANVYFGIGHAQYIKLPCPYIDLIDVLTTAALTYREVGDYDKSLRYQTKALEIVKQVLPDKHPYLGIALNNIGKAYYKKCDYEKAMHYFEQTTQVFAHVWPDYHQRRAIPLNHLGKIYYRIKNYDQALNYYSQALDMLEKTVSINHADSAYTLKNMGEVHLDLLDFDKAYNYFYRALNIYKEKFGSNTDQREIAKCYHLIGQVYLKQNDYEHALEYFHVTL
ncbi:unnamed protein product, partial [Rotaria sordida]